MKSLFTGFFHELMLLLYHMIKQMGKKLSCAIDVQFGGKSKIRLYYLSKIQIFGKFLIPPFPEEKPPAICNLV